MVRSEDFQLGNGERWWFLLERDAKAAASQNCARSVSDCLSRSLSFLLTTTTPQPVWGRKEINPMFTPREIVPGLPHRPVWYLSKR